MGLFPEHELDVVASAGSDGAASGTASSRIVNSDSVADMTLPLAARLRPRNFDEFVGQSHLVAPEAPLRRAIEPTARPPAFSSAPPAPVKHRWRACAPVKRWRTSKTFPLSPEAWPMCAALSPPPTRDAKQRRVLVGASCSGPSLRR
jgi:hypothetical protein